MRICPIIMLFSSAITAVLILNLATVKYIFLGARWATKNLICLTGLYQPLAVSRFYSCTNISIRRSLTNTVLSTEVFMQRDRKIGITGYREKLSLNFPIVLFQE